MQKTLAAAVAGLAIIGFTVPALACGGGMKTAGSVGLEIASADQATKPVQQTLIPTEKKTQ